MTALNISADIPPDIDTLEKLHVWTCQALSYLYKSETVQESSNRLSRVVDAAPFEVTTDTPVQTRLITRTTIAIAPEWQTGAGGMWNYAEEIGVENLPEAFKQSQSV